jgi:PAS domain S-box-containing protein
MERILLFLADQEACGQIREYLAGDYQVAAAASAAALAEPCDLAIVDLPALERLTPPLQARKQLEAPIRFPVLLAVPPQELTGMAAELGDTVDEFILLPLKPQEIRLRVRNLLEARRLSQTLETAAAPPEAQAEEWGKRKHELERRIEELQTQKGELEELAGKLLTERECLKTALEQMPAGVLIAEVPSGRILMANRRAGEIWPRPLNYLTDIVEFCLYPRFIQDGSRDQSQDVPLMRSLIGEEVILDEEIATVREDGSRTFFSVSAAPIKDHRGRILAGVVTVTDITGRKEAAGALRKSSERNEQILESISDGFFSLDQEMTVTYYNNAAAKILGLTREEVLGRKLFDAFPEARGSIFEEKYAEALRERKFISFEAYFEPEAYRNWYDVRVYTYEGGVSVYFLVTTARKEAEEALRRAKEEWERTFDAVPDLIAILDQEHRIVRCNQAMAAALGQEPGQLLGRTCYAAVHGLAEPPPFCPHTRVLQDGKVHTTEVQELGGDFLVTASPLADEQGRILGSVHVARDITEPKRVEAALRESEERLRMAQHVARIGTFEWNTRTGLNTWTLELESMYGLPPGGFALTQSAWENLIHPADRSEAVRQVELAFETGEPVEGEWRVVWPDGSLHWLAGRWQVFKDDSGEPLRMTGINIDITERKQAEEAIRRQVELLDLAHDAIFVWDLQDRIVFWNRGAEEIYGWTREEAMAQNVRQLLKTEFPQPLKEIEAEILQAGRWEGDLVHHTRDGRRLVMAASWALHRDEPGKPARILEICTDITARKLAEEQLKKAHDELETRVEERTAELKDTVEQLQREVEERQAAEEALARHAALVHDLYNSAPCGYHSLDPEGRLVQINDTELAWLGYTRDEVVGRLQYADILTPASQQTFQKNFPCFKERGWVRDLEFELVRKDGTVMPVLLSATVIRDEAGRYVMSRSTVYDITDRRRAEEALRASEARFAQFMRYLPGAAIMRDLQGRYVFVNEGWEELFQMKSAEILGKTLTEVWPARDADRFKDMDQLVLAGDRAVQAVEKFPVGRGYGYFLTSRFPIMDREGRMVMLGGIGIDITAHHRAEEALREKTRLLDAFFEHALTPQVFLDKDFNFLRVNRAYAVACQREASEFPGHNHFEFYPNAENQAIFEEAVRTKVSHQAVAKPFVFPDHPELGVTYWDWTLAPILDEQGEVDFLVFSLNDVTERHRAEEARSQLIEIMEATPDLVGIANPSGQVLYLNSAGREMLGLGTEADISQFNIAQAHTPWAAAMVLQEGFPVAGRGGLWRGETALLGPGGREIPISQVILGHKDAQGQVKFYSTVGRDITAQKQAEVALKDSEQKLRFLATQILKVQELERGRLSRELHDGLGQALLVFKLQLRAIQRQLPQDWQDLRRDTNFALQYMDEIIEDIRRLSHNLSPTVLEDIGLNAAIKNLCDEFKRLHEVEIRLDLDEVENLFGREPQTNIYRIFQEALTNISKYAGAQRVFLAMKKQGGEIVFSIADDGAGFDVAEVLARGATERGMGLAAMFERVRILGGVLSIASEEGQGTRIAFSVPVEIQD